MSVFICGLNPHGNASRDGRMRVGDLILEVNGHVLHDRHHLNVTSLIKGLPDSDVTFILLRTKAGVDDLAVKPLSHFPEMPYKDNPIERYKGKYKGLREVTILKGDQGLGIMIIEGKHAEAGTGVFVSDLQHGSCADVAGLRRGDMILAVNGEDFVGVNYDTAASILKTSEGQIKMIVANPISVQQQIQQEAKEKETPSPVKKQQQQPEQQPAKAEAEAEEAQQEQEPEAEQEPQEAAGAEEEKPSADSPAKPRLPPKPAVAPKPVKLSSPAHKQEAAAVPAKTASPAPEEKPKDKEKEKEKPAVKAPAPAPPAKAKASNLPVPAGSRKPVASPRRKVAENASNCEITPGADTTIEITKDKDEDGKPMGLGLSIVGGSDTLLGAIFIHEVYEKGAAHKDGRLRPGDQVRGRGRKLQQGRTRLAHYPLNTVDALCSRIDPNWVSLLSMHHWLQRTTRVKRS